MQCPRCQQENPREANFCLNCATPLKRARPADPDLNDKVDGLRRALSAALEQQTATSDILRVISSSPTDVQPVFDAIAQSAARLCEAQFCFVYRFDGQVLHFMAHHGVTNEGAEAVRRTFPAPPSRGSAAARAVLDCSVAQIPDVRLDSDFALRPAAMLAGYRSAVAVPMMRGGLPIGAIAVGRAQTGLSPDWQVNLLKTFADQAVIAIENVRLFKELEARNRDLTATSEILRVISRSPTDVQPVFDTIAAAATTLCAAENAGVFLFDGTLIHFAAHHHWTAKDLDAIRETFPRPPGPGTVTGRAILTRAVAHTADVAADPGYEVRGFVDEGFRAILSVPMLRDGDPIGAISVLRREAVPFTDKQIALLQTFADQAVIAIENVRLFKELEARNHDLTEALEQQTATAEILRVIGSSPTDAQPVFEAIVSSARRLLGGFSGGIYRLIGDEIHLAAYTSTTPSGDAALRSIYPRPLAGFSFAGEAIRERIAVVASDIETDSRVQNDMRRRIRERGFRSGVWVPMLREGAAIGVIGVTRSEPGAFADEQIALLQTFADQAVIAIENVRLFTELQASNRELTAALDTQTATSDILRVISRSQTDVQPVFDAIVDSAVRLLGAYASVLTRIAGDQIEFAAHTSTDDTGDAPVRAAFPQSRHSEWPAAQAIRDRAPINIADAHTDPRVPETLHALARVRGYRSLVVVPLLRHDEAVGAIAVSRREPGGFTDDEIALLQTFADQAVIAIENVSLFKELEARTAELTRSVGELTALGEISQVLSSTLDLETVLTTIVSRAVQLSGLDGGVVFEYDDATEEFVHRAATETGGTLAEARRTTRVRRGEGMVGQTAITLEPAQVPDITEPGVYDSRLRGNLIESGVRGILAVPMVRESQLIGCLVVSRNRPGDFPAETVELLRTFATQSALAIQNARLFHEIEDKSQQLEAASRHKSEFLANMSHELRTPLNAILGFSEVLAQGMFGDVNEKQSEYLHDILESGRHLLSLINDILDLSKIEAGRMELELSEFDLPQAIQNALTLVRERALRHGIALHHVIDDRVADIRGDERKVKQVLLNLLSNAIKFTPEGGRIEVRAASTDGMVEVSVTDTGIGIAPEDLEAVFEEFRQVGTADKKAEGTGLGLALSRKFIELHGGRIWVTSQVGVGSTFTFTLPVRPWPAS
jgi:GAF domain-containing protein